MQVSDFVCGPVMPGTHLTIHDEKCIFIAPWWAPTAPNRKEFAYKIICGGSSRLRSQITWVPNVDKGHGVLSLFHILDDRTQTNNDNNILVWSRHGIVSANFSDGGVHMTRKTGTGEQIDNLF